MASRFWAPLCTSLALLAPAFSHADAFGRFGYGDFAVPGFRFEKDGFRVSSGSADKFSFVREARQWKPVGTTALEQTVVLGDFHGAPSKARVCLTSPGFELFFPTGLDLRLTGLTPPMLSFPEGGTIEGDAGIPTPALKWAVISFRDRQPPVLLCFLGAPHALRMEGSPGQWRLRTEGEFAGWVRFAAPTGIRARATNTAAELGGLMAEIGKEAEFWSQPSPKLLSQEVAEDDTGVVATWTFDRPLAIVPPVIAMAGVAGYRMPLTGKVRRIDAPTLEGPIDALEGKTLTFRVSARRIPTGRSVTQKPAPPPFGTASYLDYAGVSELALANCLASADDPTRKLADATYTEFLTATEQTAEPATGQNLLYRADGKDLDLVGAHALLMQSTISARRAGSTENSLLTSLIWRRDWFTGRLWSPSVESGRRAAALGAIAAAMAPEPERRFEGAMLYAGLLAEKGRRVWLQRNRLPLETAPEPKIAFPELLVDLYAAEDYRRKPGFGSALLGDLRSYGDGALALELDGEAWAIQLPVEAGQNVQLTFAAGYPIEFVVPAGWTVQSGLGFSFVRGKSEAAGVVKIGLKIPSWAAKPPVVTEVPRFVER